MLRAHRIRLILFTINKELIGINVIYNAKYTRARYTNKPLVHGYICCMSRAEIKVPWKTYIVHSQTIHMQRVQQDPRGKAVMCIIYCCVEVYYTLQMGPEEMSAPVCPK